MHPFQRLPLTVLGLLVLAWPGLAAAQLRTSYRLASFTTETGSDLGYGNYPAEGATAAQGKQCKASASVQGAGTVHLTLVSVTGTQTQPKAVAVHSPFARGTAKNPAGQDKDWSATTHEHDGERRPDGTWTVILAYPQSQGMIRPGSDACQVAYGNKVYLKFSKQ